MRCIVFVLFAGFAGAQSGLYREASMEDLVSASAGRLGVYARNLTSGKEISLNGIGRRDVGSMLRMVVAGASLSARRAESESASVLLPYPQASYRGARGKLRHEHGRTYTVRELVATTIHHDDPAATDLLIDWLGPRLTEFSSGTGVKALGQPVSHARREAAVLKALDPRFADVPPAPGSRWLHDQKTSAIVPAWFPSDPRRHPEHVARLSRAWDAWYARGEESASPRAVADLLHMLLRSSQGHVEDATALIKLLRGVPRVAIARDLPLHVAVAGLDSETYRRRTSAAIVDTSQGTVLVCVHASGYARKQDAAHFLSVLGFSAVRRLAPGALRPPEEPHKRPRSLKRTRIAARGDGADAPNRTRFSVGETARLRVDLAPEHEMVCVVRWTRPTGTHVREARGAAARRTKQLEFDLLLDRSGWHELELALDNRVVSRWRLQVSE